MYDIFHSILLFFFLQTKHKTRHSISHWNIIFKYIKSINDMEKNKYLITFN